MKRSYEFYSGGFKLSLECYPAPNSKKKGLIFYAGGGWLDDNRFRFQRFAEDLADRGITVFLPQYRVYGIHRATPSVCVEDVKKGLVFASGLLEEYGIFPQGLSWGGGSAGAQLVLSSLLIENHRKDVPLLPQKMVLLNPVCCPHSLKDWLNEQGIQRFGASEWEKARQEMNDYGGLCPLHDMDCGDHLPEILALHGTKDEIAPFGDLNRLSEKYRSAGGKFWIVPYPGRGHGFHHPDISEADYQDTLCRIADFL